MNDQEKKCPQCGFKASNFTICPECTDVGMVDKDTESHAPSGQAEFDLLEAEGGKWYWMTHPHEGDVWYPIWIGPDYCLFDGKRRPQEDFKNLILKEAILPDGL